MRGFTFVELVIVVAIMGIIASLAAPMLLSSLDNARLYGAVSEVATAMNYARTTASGSGLATRITVDEVAETVLLEETVLDKKADILNPAISTIDEADIEQNFAFVTMVHPVQADRDYLVDLGGDSPYAGVDITLVSGGNTVTFDTRGVPSGAIEIGLSSGDHTARIAIDALTGKVTSTM